MVARGSVSYRKTSSCKETLWAEIEPQILPQPISEKLETVDYLL